MLFFVMIFVLAIFTIALALTAEKEQSSAFDIKVYYDRAGIPYVAPLKENYLGLDDYSNDTILKANPQIPVPALYYNSPNSHFLRGAWYNVTKRPDNFKGSCVLGDTFIIPNGYPMDSLNGHCINEKMFMGSSFCKDTKCVRYEIPARCPQNRYCHNVTAKIIKFGPSFKTVEYTQSFCNSTIPTVTSVDDLLKNVKILKEFQTGGSAVDSKVIVVLMSLFVSI
jgi:hypothetical protein